MTKSTNRLIMIILAAIVLAAIAFIVYNRISGGQNAGANSIDYSIQPALGDANAPVKVAMFEDYTCGACGAFTENVLPRLKSDFLEDGNAQFYFMNYQVLSQNSIMAGLAGDCAYAQDEDLFWDYKTVLMRGQNQFAYTPRELASLASNVPGLDADALESCIDEKTYLDDVTADLQLGRNLGVNSTPTIFVNGEMVTRNGRSDPSYESIKAAIESALVAASSQSN